MTRSASNLLPALIKYWRGRRGLSQLDLALAADVSARHVSFLETGRAQPSREMLLRLGAALGVPLRDQNAMLRAAGFEPRWPEPDADELPPAVAQALARMLAQQEPYPLVVMNRRHDILRANAAATRLIGRMVAEPSALTVPINAFELVFDPRLARSAVVDWEAVARGLLWRLHREALERPADEALAGLLRALHAMPGVPEAWRQPDLSLVPDPVFTLRLRRGPLELGFLTTLTGFTAPHSVTLEELMIEAYYPLDEATAAACAALAAPGA